MTSSAADQTVRLCVFGKGFIVTQSTEEFQRVVPIESAGQVPLSENEIRLASCRWERVLEGLYPLSEAEHRANYCVLLSMNEATVVATGKSLDKHNRPTVVVVSATTDITWDNPQTVAASIGKARTIADRLSAAYSASFRHSPAHIQAQLRSGRFLPSRELSAVDEDVDRPSYWEAIVAAVAKWRGVTGIATRALFQCGANVLIGTQAEGLEASADGYFDIHGRDIVPLRATLTPWHPTRDAPMDVAAVQTTAPTVKEPQSGNEPLNEIARSLRGIENAVTSMVKICAEFLDLMYGHLHSETEDLGRKRKRDRD